MRRTDGEDALRSKDLDGCAQTAQGLASQGLPGFFEKCCEVGAGQHRPLQDLGQGFDARDLVGGRADGRELQALGNADIAIGEVADMEGDPATDGDLALAGAPCVQALDCRNGLFGGVARRFCHGFGA
jgi:hypothetical protein